MAERYGSGNRLHSESRFPEQNTQKIGAEHQHCGAPRRSWYAPIGMMEPPRRRLQYAVLAHLLSATLAAAAASAPSDPTANAAPSATAPSASSSAPSPSAASSEPPLAPAAPSLPTLTLSRHTLPNGLRVVLNPDTTSPSVAVCVTYDVGSRQERENQSGFAHLFEHLMFQGSRNLEKGQHFALVAEHGGRMNGTTNKERTNYFEIVPAEALPLALWLEADRMKGLALTRENFDNQRAVVEEEYRKSYANRVYGLAQLRLSELVFQGHWPYEHATIGDLTELDRAEFEWAREFHRQYYAPNNAVLSIAGNFEPQAALQWIERFFADAQPSTALPTAEDFEFEFTQGSERFNVVVDEGAKTPALFLAWPVPKSRSPQRRALELASEVLTGGDSGRLYQSLVIEKASALSVHSWLAGERGPSMFALKIVVAPLSNVDTAQKWLEGELKRLRLIGPSDDELNRARARLEMARLTSLQSSQRRAVALGEYEVFYGDASLLNDDLLEYRDISAEDVRKAAQEYLIDTRRSIVEAYPPGWVRDLGPVITTTTYVVQKGDTLSGIAAKHGTTVEAITQGNRIDKGRAIQPGQHLLVTLGAGFSVAPKAVTKKHIVKKGDTLSGIAHKYGTDSATIAKENKLSTKKAIFPGQELTITVEVSTDKPKPATPGAAKTKAPAPKENKAPTAKENKAKETKAPSAPPTKPAAKNPPKTTAPKTVLPKTLPPKVQTPTKKK